MRIEPIKPRINEIPIEWEQDKENPLCFKVIKSEKQQNGWDFGENGLVGKLNEIIEWINSKNDQLL